MKIIFLFVFIILFFQFSCGSNHPCEIQYTQVSMIDSLADDTLKIKISRFNNQLYLIKDFYCNSHKTIFKYPFINTDMHEMDSKLVFAPECEGNFCDSLSFLNEGKGYLIVVLKKNEKYIQFKHIVFNELFDSMSYLDSTQIYKWNNNPNLPERYYKLDRLSLNLLEYKSIDGKFDFSFNY